MARSVAVQYGPSIIPVLVRLPNTAMPLFENDDKTIEEILSDCQLKGLINKSTSVPYQFRYVSVNIGMPRAIAEQIYQTMPIGADSNSLSRFVGVMLAKYYGVDILPVSGRLATSVDNKMSVLMERVEKALA